MLIFRMDPAFPVQFDCVFIIFPSPHSILCYLCTFSFSCNHFLCMFSPQLIASNTEGKSSPSEVLVCTTNPDKPGPPSPPCVAAATPYGFTVTWGNNNVTAPESPVRGCRNRFKVQVDLGSTLRCTEPVRRRHIQAGYCKSDASAVKVIKL